MTLRVATLGWILILVLVAPTARSESAARGPSVLSSAELETTRGVSRAVFAAQRAEREEAQRAGLVDLAVEVRRLRAALGELRRLDPAMAPPSASEGAAPAEARPADTQGLRELRSTDFAAARGAARARKQALRDRLPSIRSERQRAVAEAALQRLDALDAELDAVLDGASPEQADRVDRLAERFGALERDLDAGSTAATELDPTFSTIVRHRRPVPRTSD